MQEITKEYMEGYVGRSLMETESRMIECLSGQDESTIGAFKTLIESSHRFGYICGEKDAKYR